MLYIDVVGAREIFGFLTKANFKMQKFLLFFSCFNRIQEVY